MRPSTLRVAKEFLKASSRMQSTKSDPGGAALWGVLLGHTGLRPQPPGCVPLVREVRGRWPKGATDITWVGADGVA